MNKKTPTIPAPSDAMYGVAIRANGVFENVGIGSFNVDQAEQLADQLVLLAEAIRAKGKGVFPAK